MIDARIVVDSSANMTAEQDFVVSVPLKIITDRKEYVDEIAAIFILQGYLDFLANQKQV